MIDPALITNQPASLQYLPSAEKEKAHDQVNLLADDIKQALALITLVPLYEHLPAVLYFSTFFAKTCQRFPQDIAKLISCNDLQTDYPHDYLISKIHESCRDIEDIAQLNATLRKIRHLEMARIVWRELSGICGTQGTIRDLSDLADACLQVALEKHNLRLSQKYGQPIEQGSTNIANFVVFGLGKLGGRELNFSSDIDLIFAYSAIGQTQAEKTLSNNEYFIKLGQAVIKTLNEIDHDGQVYRVDMRLRPNGHSGPLVMSFSAMENYYQIHGREWERYAWIKARVVAGNFKTGNSFLNQLRPFVYRKYLDYQVYDSLEEMKSMINKEIRQQGKQQNIKLGRGGIREIEFIVQSHQLVRGGRDPSLRTRSLKQALFALSSARQIEPATANTLYQIYLFLRGVEHRLQMKNDQQTHDLPTDEQSVLDLSSSMGYEKEEFNCLLEDCRDFVQAEFTRLHSQKEDSQASNQWQLFWNQIINNQSPELIETQNKDYFVILAAYVKSKAYRSLEARGQKILDNLIPKILQLISLQAQPEQALNRCLQVLSSIGGRIAYLSLLDQFPLACKQLVQLCGASPWVSKWIANHPIVLDTLINPRTDLYSFNNDIESLIEASIVEESDEELKHDMLRQIHHSCILQIAMADLQSQYDAGEIRRYISYVAESIINQVVKLCQLELQPRFGMPVTTDNQDPFAVIAYGKLGSNELSYNADLDLVFIFDDTCISEETEGGRKSVRSDYYYSRLVQRIVTMLTMQTSAGKLYDVDTRLRPSGRSGLLVSSLTQYRKYLKEQAWVWEHQAFVKARMITQNPKLKKSFRHLRSELLCQPRDKSELFTEIASMRKRMRDASTAAAVAYKVEQGGMIDIEFISQYMVLRFANDYPEICACRSVIDVLKFSKQHALMQSIDADTLIKTYQTILQVENQFKLNSVIDEPLRIKLESQMESVNKIWCEFVAGSG